MTLFAEYAVTTATRPTPDTTPAAPLPEGTSFFDITSLPPVEVPPVIPNEPIHVTAPSTEFAGSLAVHAASIRGIGDVEVLSIEFIRYRNHSLDLESGLPIDTDGNPVDISNEDDTVDVVGLQAEGLAS